MRRIVKILYTERKHKDKKPYYITHALVDSGDECKGYGRDFTLGDYVEVFYHYGQIKMRKHED